MKGHLAEIPTIRIENLTILETWGSSQTAAVGLCESLAAPCKFHIAWSSHALREEEKTRPVSMKAPYNRLQVYDSVLFAARGGKIHSFSTENGSYISTWKHPDVDMAAPKPESGNGTSDVEAAPHTQVTVEAPSPEQPPSRKRQRLLEAVRDVETAAAATAVGESTDEARDGQEDGGTPHGRRAKGKRGRHRHKDAISKVPDRPTVSLLAITTDGRHLVAVSGHDKSIWVFKHREAGRLEELSKR